MELSRHWDHIAVNKMISTTLPNTYFPNALKPDIVVKSQNLVNIIDVACPYDIHLESLHVRKISYYDDSRRQITLSGLQCNVYAIIIGSLGTVHYKALDTLKCLKLPKLQSKGLLKWSSTSNIISAKIIWDIRCRLVHE